MEDLKLILEGKAASPRSSADVACDRAAGFVPKTKDNVGYIVSAVLFNDSGEVLMIQEAKSSCHGKWYLPAGRLEPGESLVEGVKREVLEETGFTFKPSTLIAVDIGNGSWYRLTFTGTITGGKLKTLEEKDEESLQAQWMTCEDVLNRKIPIRSTDMFALIKMGREHRALAAVEKLPTYLPCTTGHTQLILRPVVVLREPSGTLHILVNSRGEDHLPTAVISPQEFGLEVISRFFRNVYAGMDQAPEVYGLVGLEYSGEPDAEKDGICFSLLMELNHEHVKDVNQLENNNYHWRVIEDKELVSELGKRLDKKFCVPVSCV